MSTLALRLRAAAVAPLFARLDHDPVLAPLREADSVSASVADVLWREASAGNEARYALEVAARAQPQTYGLLSYLVATSPTVATALRTLVSHYALLSTAARFELRVDRRSVTVSCHVDGTQPSAARQIFGVAIVVAFLRRQAPDLPPPLAVELAVDRRIDVQACVQSFGCPVATERDVSSVRWPRDALDARLRGGDATLRGILVAHARADTPADTPWTTRVREVLTTTPRATELPATAGALGVSPRTLRRKLMTEGAAFSTIRDDVLAARAQAALREGERIEVVAARLGYADAAAFRRAFRRWTSMAPGDYRRTFTRPAPSR